MGKKEVVSLDYVVDKAYSSTIIDEKLIAKFLDKTIDELDKEFKAIDKIYDSKFESFDKDIRILYTDWIKDKQRRREFVEDLIKKETDSLEREKLLNSWFKINSEIDALCSEKKEYLRSYGVKLTDEKAKKEKKTLTVQMTKALVPVAIKSVLIGLVMIANANNINAIDTSAPKIAEK